MMKFHVADMTCGHCVSLITRAILQLQDDAKVEADLVNATVSVYSTLSAEEIADAIKDAGYSATSQKASCCNPSNSCHT
ncbi:MAG: heavy-metal-associated domain-containing protein [Gammaproteobacteria bacterium]|jgi:copper chaperone|nr:heavy-metal-associated domain-containing protein [Gammaproteobacteria bacterium]MBU1553735.1 heavy-metal-associated domain-containing protein [Gammaproteobacteria bacterium]